MSELPKPVEGLYCSLEGGCFTREIEVGDAFVYDDGTAWMVTSIGDDIEWRKVEAEELAVLRERRRLRSQRRTG